MLRSTFLHVPGVGKKTERKLWRDGIERWKDALESSISVMGDARCQELCKYAQASKNAVQEDNPAFFDNMLSSKHQWRSYTEFDTCFLDIETTGLDADRHDVTVVGIYDGDESDVFVRGRDLEKLPKALEQYGHVVTFNGARFDLPFLEQNLDVEFTQLHTDLMFLLRGLGYSGGLKAIEPEFGISREDAVDDVDGAEAVRLWHQYQNGDEDALRRLIKYNIEDIENLKVLMDEAYRMKKDEVTGQLSTDSL